MRTFRSNEIYADSSRKVIAVEVMEYHRSRSAHFCHVIGNVQPLAIVVCGPGETVAYDMEAQPADLEQLRQDIPELDITVRAFGRT